VITKDRFIIDVWERLDKDVAGASEIEAIRKTVAERFGDAGASPASSARALADRGIRLGHPEVLQTDVEWREGRQLFTPDDLALDTLPAAKALMEKIELLRERLEGADHLRHAVRQLKGELELLSASDKVSESKRQLAGEVAQWLTIWLQNPQLFQDWLALRFEAAEFRERFGI
jgi:hypothetical protein